MKYGTFLARLLCSVLICGALMHYQVIAKERAAEVEANQEAVDEANAWNAEVLRQIEDAAFPYNDGTFEGSGEGFGGPIQVSVTIRDGQIETIEVLSHAGEDAAYYEQAEKVIERMQKAQSAEVDTVSGATFSSRGLIDAVSDALGKAAK